MASDPAGDLDPYTFLLSRPFASMWHPSDGLSTTYPGLTADTIRTLDPEREKFFDLFLL